MRTAAVVLPDGEAHKDWETLNRIFDMLLAERCERSTTLVALGGGVVGDMGGFAAACYQRGMPFIQVPTTLLSQVDSSVGGKTAINHPLGKNMIGAFYQPRLVLADIDTLDTLPDRELSAGLAEVIKYGLIRDPEFLAWLEANLDRLVARDTDALAWAIERSCRNKAEVVAADETEQGERALLNLGHTFGHAIETGLGYGEWLHGEAVAAGTMMAAELSRRLGWIDAADGGAHRRAVRARPPAGVGAAAGRRALPRADGARQEGRGRQAAPGAAARDRARGDAWRGAGRRDRRGDRGALPLSSAAGALAGRLAARRRSGIARRSVLPVFVLPRHLRSSHAATRPLCRHRSRLARPRP